MQDVEGKAWSGGMAKFIMRVGVLSASGGRVRRKQGISHATATQAGQILQSSAGRPLNGAKNQRQQLQHQRGLAALQQLPGPAMAAAANTSQASTVMTQEQVLLQSQGLAGNGTVAAAAAPEAASHQMQLAAGHFGGRNTQLLMRVQDSIPPAGDDSAEQQQQEEAAAAAHNNWWAAQDQQWFQQNLQLAFGAAATVGQDYGLLVATAAASTWCCSCGTGARQAEAASRAASSTTVC
jgi:hypothetical protein